MEGERELKVREIATPAATVVEKAELGSGQLKRPRGCGSIDQLMKVKKIQAPPSPVRPLS